MRLPSLALALVFSAGCLNTTAYTPNPGSGGSGGSGGGAGSGGSGGSGGAGGAGGSGGSGGSAGSDGGTTGGTAATKSGPITSDEMWSGFVQVTGDVTINAGVTVTINDGALVKVATGHAITVAGTLKLTGSATTGIKMQPDPSPGSWNGISVSSGGTLDVAYAELDSPTNGLTCATGAAGCTADHLSILGYTGMGVTMSAPGTFTWLKLENTAGGGGGIFVNAGASDLVTITDSTFHNTGGDSVTCDGGNLTMSYSHMLAATPGGNSGIHCATHFTTMGVIKLDHNIMENTNWGLMASNMSASSKINMNNFIGYGIAANDGGAWSQASGTNITAGVDLTNNYWNGDAAPTNTGTSLVTSSYIKTQVPNCGPGATR